MDRGASPGLENRFRESKPPTVAETPSHRPRQATIGLQREVPSQRNPCQTSGHALNPSTGLFVPDQSLGIGTTSTAIRRDQPLRDAPAAMDPQQRVHASIEGAEYANNAGDRESRKYDANQQNSMHLEATASSNIAASGSNRVIHQSEGHRPAESSTPRSTNATHPQLIPVGETPLNDIQKVRTQYRMYAQLFYELNQPQKEEMKILRGVIDAHETTSSRRPQRNGRGPARGSRTNTHYQPAAKRNVKHVDLSSDTDDHVLTRNRPKKARQILDDNNDTAMYEDTKGPTTAMNGANQRDGAIRKTKGVDPKKSVQRWVSEQSKQTNAMPNQDQRIHPDELDPASQQSDSSSVLDVRPLRHQVEEPNVQYHRDGTRTEHFRLRPREMLISMPFGRLAHFVPPDTILMVVSPDDDCGYVCPSGTTEVRTRTYMSLAAAQLGMIAAYQVKNMQEARVPLEHIKVAVYDDRLGFTEPTAGVDDEGQVASLLHHMERAVEPSNDDGDGVLGPAAGSNGDVRVESPSRDVGQPANTLSSGNRTPMIQADHINSNAGAAQKGTATTSSTEKSRQQDPQPAAVDPQTDQPAQDQHIHSQISDAGISDNDIAMPHLQSHPNLSNLNGEAQSIANSHVSPVNQRTANAQECTVHQQVASRSPSYPELDAMFNAQEHPMHPSPAEAKSNAEPAADRAMDVSDRPMIEESGNAMRDVDYDIDRDMAH